MNTQQERIRIEGMSCGHCVAAVRRALNEVEGVEVEDVTVGEACVRYDPAEVDRTTIEDAIREEGFAVQG